jgi:hypothetical protein
MRTRTITFTVTSLIAILSAAPAQAALTQVNMRIEGASKTLFEGPILTEGHGVSSYKADGGNATEDLAEHPCDGINPNDPENSTPGPTPTAASVDAMNTIGETDSLAGQWYGNYDDYFVKQWGGEEENAEAGSRSWGLLVNNVFTSIGGCQYELHTGDEVLWVYNAFESRPILGLFAANEHYSSGTRPLTAQAQLNQPFEVEVAAYDDHGEGQPPATPERTAKNTEPYEGAEVSPVSTSEKGFETVQTKNPETVTTDSEGKADITFTTPGWHRIIAGTPLDVKGEEAAIRSNRLDVCVPAPGETGCGALPAEDEARTPPRYLHEGEGQNPAPLTTNTGDSAVPAASGTPKTQPSPSASTVRSTTLARVSIDGRKLKLDFTAAGAATVQIARKSGRGRHRHWQILERFAVRAKRAGAVRVELPRLVPGVYRVTVSLPGARSIVKTLTVPHTQR